MCFDALESLLVETVGDCYVAASGIPDYNKDHAVLMVKFARSILREMNKLTKILEISLGPDTGEFKFCAVAVAALREASFGHLDLTASFPLHPFLPLYECQVIYPCVSVYIQDQ